MPHSDGDGYAWDMASRARDRASDNADRIAQLETQLRYMGEVQAGLINRIAALEVAQRKS